MAGYLEINPRHRKRRRRRTRRHHARASNPRHHRRRRTHHRRTHAMNPRRHYRRRHYRRNPRLGGAFTPVIQGLGVGIGAGVVKWAADQLNTKLPTSMQTGFGPVVLEAALGAGLALVAHQVKPLRNFAKPIALGAGALVAFELWNQYVAPNLPQLMPAAGAGTASGYMYRGVALSPGSMSGYELANRGGGMAGASLYSRGVYGVNAG